MREQAFIIDVSKHQARFDADVLKRAGGKAVIIKASMGYGRDPAVARHVATAKAAGLPFGLYHWCDPTATVASQAEIFAGCIRLFNPDFLMVDAEQWWRSWEAWYRWMNGEIPREQVSKFSNGEITANADGVINRVRAMFPDKFLMMYTAQWFTNEYAPALARLQVPLAVADYTGFKTRRFVKAEEMPGIVAGLEDQVPLLPVGAVQTWELHQFSDNIVIDGLTGSIVDCNRTRRPWSEFAALIGVAGEGEEPPVPTAWKVRVTAAPGLRIRALPTIYSDRIGVLIYSAVVAVEAEQEGWLKLADREGWICKEWTRAVSS